MCVVYSIVQRNWYVLFELLYGVVEIFRTSTSLEKLHIAMLYVVCVAVEAYFLSHQKYVL